MTEEEKIKALEIKVEQLTNMVNFIVNKLKKDDKPRP